MPVLINDRAAANCNLMPGAGLLSAQMAAIDAECVAIVAVGDPTLEPQVSAAFTALDVAYQAMLVDLAAVNAGTIPASTFIAALATLAAAVATAAVLPLSYQVNHQLAGTPPPQMTTAQRALLVLPKKGGEIFNTTTNQPEVNVGTSGAPVWVAMSEAALTGANEVVRATATGLAGDPNFTDDGAGDISILDGAAPAKLVRSWTGASRTEALVDENGKTIETNVATAASRLLSWLDEAGKTLLSASRLAASRIVSWDDDAGNAIESTDTKAANRTKTLVDVNGKNMEVRTTTAARLIQWFDDQVAAKSFLKAVLTNVTRTFELDDDAGLPILSLSTKGASFRLLSFIDELGKNVLQIFSSAGGPGRALQIFDVTGVHAAFSAEYDTSATQFLLSDQGGNAIRKYNQANATRTIQDFDAAGNQVAAIVAKAGGTYLTVGNAAPSAASALEVQSTTQGVRFPNMTTAQKNAIANVAGLVVFDTTLGKLCVNGGAGWQTITSA